ncbi:MAG TPA: DUF4347 domain-containing protein [Aquabacterium sp.]|nr:DUF4347 domain-containing protein [Aquabacterium sp.]
MPMALHPSSSSPRPVVERMEDRILHAADLLPSGGAADPGAVVALQASLQPAQDPATVLRHEIVVVDAGLPDAQALVDQLQRDGRRLDIVWLQPGDDGIARIGAALQGREGIDALHLLTHGAGGQVQLGATRLDGATLLARADEVAAWGAALSAQADLLLYGCDVAADADGRQLVADLGLLTGADVAASTDLTGAAALGGDWQLELATGRIDTPLLLDAAAQAAYAGTLAITDNGTSSAATVGAQASLSFAHTVGAGANGLLLVQVVSADALSALAVTYGGTPLTYVGKAWSQAVEVSVQLWQLKAPAAGTANVVVSLPVPLHSVAGATSFLGVDQTTPLGSVVQNKAADGAPTLTVAAAPGDRVIDIVGALRMAGSTVGAGQTLAWGASTGTAAGDVLGVSSTEPGAASVTMSHSLTSAGGSGRWVSLAAVVKPVALAAPVITSHGGGASASITVAENTTAVGTVTATDADGPTTTFSIAGGADAALFTIDPASGALAFVVAPDHEAPQDAEQDNVYHLVVQASDGTLADTQALAVTVSDLGGPLVVSTDSDVLDGDVTSIEALITRPGTDGAISLREALLAANNTGNTGGVPDRIHFAIGGGGVRTITPTSALPTLTEAVVIDGSTQGGWAGAPLIVLAGNAAGVADGLTIGAGAGGSTVRGLVINRFTGNGLSLLGGNNILQGNYIGTVADGSAAAGNAGGGLYITSGGNLIGGTTAALRNLVSGNGIGDTPGIEINGAAATGNLLLGNYIGVNAAGTAAIGNASEGIVVYGGAANTTIGGTAAGAGNLIAGNSDPTSSGLWISGGGGNLIQGNRFGTSADGTLAIGNGYAGILIDNASDNTIGGTVAGAGNVIANAVVAHGVAIQGASAQRNAILGNTIYGNAQLGIDIKGAWTPGVNDGLTSPLLANAGMDSPVFTAVTLAGNTLTVAGYVGSAAGQSAFAGARVEVFAASADVSGYGEGRTYLGHLTSDAGGRFAGSLAVSGLSAGMRLTGTATDASGNSSEFGLNRLVVANNAPVLSGANALSGISEDIGSGGANGGTKVSALVAGRVSDVDPGAVAGIAVTSVDTTLGGWQFSTDDGGTWQALGTPSEGQARLLTAASLVRLVPAADWSGSAAAALTFRAWDTTSGTAGDTADVSTAGGTTAFSAASATASIAVSAVNDAPVVTLPSAPALLEDQRTAIAGLSVADADQGRGMPGFELASLRLHVSNGTLDVTLAGAAGISAGANASASLTLVGNQADLQATLATLHYQGGANFNGGDTLVVHGRDGAGQTHVRNLALVIAPVNDAPSGRDLGLVVGQGGSHLFSRGDFGFADAPGEGHNLSGVLLQQPSAGTLWLAGTALGAATEVTVAQLDAGQLVYAPAAGASGAAYATIAFQVRDDGGTAAGGIDLDPVARTLTIDVSLAANQAPVIGSAGGGATARLQVAEGSLDVGTVQATDADGDTLHYSLAAGGDAAHFSIDAVTGVVAFRAAPDHEAPADAGADNLYEFSVVASDAVGATDAQAWTVAVDNVNEAPQRLAVLADQVATQDQPLAYTVPAGSFADVDAGDALRYGATLASGAALPAWLGFDAATGRFSGTPGNADVGTLVLRITATDGAGLQAHGDFALTVANTNDAPTLARPLADQVATQDQPLAFTLPAGSFTDIDAGDALRYAATLASGAALPAWLGFDAATGRFSGTPARADVGVLTVRVAASDLSGAAITADFRLRVLSVDAAPVGRDAVLQTDEDTPLVLRLADFGFADPGDGPPHAFVAVAFVQPPSAGRLALDGRTVAAGEDVSVQDIAAGRLVYTPAADAAGDDLDRVLFRVRDAGAAGHNLDLQVRSLRIDVAPVNDAPVFRQNVLTLGVGQTVAPLISVLDPEQSASALALRVVSADGGRFIAAQGGATLTGFTLADVDAGRVLFQHDGGATAPEVVLEVSDGVAPAVRSHASVQWLVAAPEVPPLAAAPVAMAPAPAEAAAPAPTAAPAPAPAAATATAERADAADPTPTVEPAAAVGGLGGDAPAPAAPRAVPAEPAGVRPARAAAVAMVDVRPVALAGTELAGEVRPDGDFKALALSPARLLLQNDDLMRRFEELQRGLSAEAGAREAALASGVAGSLGLSVGYVVWLVRGGVLMSSMLSALPAWQLLDPLPVLARSALSGGGGDGGDAPAEDLERLFAGDHQSAADQPPEASALAADALARAAAPPHPIPPAAPAGTDLPATPAEPARAPAPIP